MLRENMLQFIDPGAGREEDSPPMADGGTKSGRLLSARTAATRAGAIGAVTIFATGHSFPPERSKFREMKSIWRVLLGRRD